MKKRILSIILSVVACFSLATTGFAVDSCVSEECEEDVQFYITEYDAYKAGEMNNSAENASSARSISGSNAYVDALRELAQYTDAELHERGYSSGNIEIIGKLREDPSYMPTDAELTAASSKFSFSFDYIDSYVSSGSCWYDFEWSFTWNSAPAYFDEDTVAFRWSEDFLMDEDSVDTTIYYNDYPHDKSLAMANSINGAQNACIYEFPMHTEGSSNIRYVTAGDGTFRLRNYDEGLSFVEVSWYYGHGVFGIVKGIVTASTDPLQFVIGPGITDMEYDSDIFYHT